MDENNHISETSLLRSICGKDFQTKSSLTVSADVPVEAAAHTNAVALGS